jgi:uncharacterized protein (TIGR01244 family)
MIAHRLDDHVFVSGQIRPGDMAEIAALGIITIVNNRPDGEEQGQPSGNEIAEAAEAAGLRYRQVPVYGGIEADQIEAMVALLYDARGKLLLYCRSGTRSSYIWALARARQGAGGETLIEQAAAAGYDLAPLRPYLRS